MAITPPSDLILDVTKAADPTEIREATNRLRSLAVSGKGDGFQLAYDSITTRAEPGVNRYNAEAAAAPHQAEKSAAEKFEAMILTQFVETMMPQGAEAVFGEGTTGEIWKSMLAEQVAGQLAASGGVGIADFISNSLTSGEHS